MDAAWAGVFALLPEQRELHFGGMDRVDSFDVNPHKGGRAEPAGTGCAQPGLPTGPAKGASAPCGGVLDVHARPPAVQAS